MINKITKGPTTALFPVPAVLVTSCLEGGEPDIITIAWTGVMNSNPPVVYASVRSRGRHSHRLIKESGQFVINIPTSDLVSVVDYCGNTSGKEVNKFKETGLTPVPASQVQAPLVAECPVNVECRVREVLSLGSHDVFIADVLAVHYNEDILDQNGKPDYDRIKPFSYCPREYRLVDRKLGFYGYSKKEK